MVRRLGPQRGIGFLTAMIIVALVAFFATLAFKMAPSYINFLQVRSVLEGMHHKPDIVERGPRAILNSVSHQLLLNDVRSITHKDFKLERLPEGLRLVVDYESRAHVLFNVDVVMHFNDSVILKNP
ncbi:MAG: DUF4845 domain-containing protein [Thiohalocapsa sp.]|nr:DUF4845 domain-containing protein [Thiohalocapsa sp.]